MSTDESAAANRAKYDEAAVRDGYRKLTRLLIEKKMTITTMESATSGQIASLITDTEGSSAVLKGAFVTYCNEAKMMQWGYRQKYWNNIRSIQKKQQKQWQQHVRNL